MAGILDYYNMGSGLATAETQGRLSGIQAQNVMSQVGLRSVEAQKIVAEIRKKKEIQEIMGEVPTTVEEPIPETGESRQRKLSPLEYQDRVGAKLIERGHGEEGLKLLKQVGDIKNQQVSELQKVMSSTISLMNVPDTSGETKIALFNQGIVPTWKGLSKLGVVTGEAPAMLEHWGEDAEKLRLRLKEIAQSDDSYEEKLKGLSVAVAEFPGEKPREAAKTMVGILEKGAEREGKTPTTRTVLRGTEKIAEEWNPASRTWKEVGRGEAPEKSLPIVRLLEEIDKVQTKNPKDPSLPILKAKLAKDISSDEFTVSVDKEGNVVVRQGPGGTAATATPANITKAQNTLDEVKLSRGLLTKLRQNLKPENVGLVGDLRGLVFGAGQQADAFAQLLVREARGAAVDSKSKITRSTFFDPNLSKMDLLANLMAYKLARINNPVGVLSDNDFSNAEKALGLGKKLTGMSDILARLDVFEELIGSSETIANERLGISKPGAEGEDRIKERIQELQRKYGLE